MEEPFLAIVLGNVLVINRCLMKFFNANIIFFLLLHFDCMSQIFFSQNEKIITNIKYKDVKNVRVLNDSTLFVQYLDNILLHNFYRRNSKQIAFDYSSESVTTNSYYLFKFGRKSIEQYSLEGKLIAKSYVDKKLLKKKPVEIISYNISSHSIFFWDYETSNITVLSINDDSVSLGKNFIKLLPNSYKFIPFSTKIIDYNKLLLTIPNDSLFYLYDKNLIEIGRGGVNMNRDFVKSECINMQESICRALQSQVNVETFKFNNKYFRHVKLPINPEDIKELQFGYPENGCGEILWYSMKESAIEVYDEEFNFVDKFKVSKDNLMIMPKYVSENYVYIIQFDKENNIVVLKNEIIY